MSRKRRFVVGFLLILFVTAGVISGWHTLQAGGQGKVEFNAHVVATCDEQPDQIDVRVQNLNGMVVRITGEIWAKEAGKEPVQIALVPEQFQEISDGDWGGPEQRISVFFPNGFSGDVSGFADVWTLDGKKLGRAELGITPLDCGGDHHKPKIEFNAHVIAICVYGKNEVEVKIQNLNSFSVRISGEIWVKEVGKDVVRVANVSEEVGPNVWGGPHINVQDVFPNGFTGDFSGWVEIRKLTGELIGRVELAITQVMSCEPKPTYTPTSTNTSTATSTNSPTASATPSPSSTPTPSVTPTGTATATTTPTGTDTPTGTATSTNSPTASATPSPSSTPTPSVTPTVTPIVTDTPSPTATQTGEVTATPTVTQTPTPVMTTVPGNGTLKLCKLAVEANFMDQGEFAFWASGWKVYVQIDSTEHEGITDGNGCAIFEVPAGTYSVREESRPFWQVIIGPSTTVTIEPGATVMVVFKNLELSRPNGSKLYLPLIIVIVIEVPGATPTPTFTPTPIVELCPLIHHQSGDRPVDGGVSPGSKSPVKFWVDNTASWSHAVWLVNEVHDGDVDQLFKESIRCSADRCETPGIHPEPGAQLLITVQLYGGESDAVPTNCGKLIYVDPPDEENPPGVEAAAASNNQLSLEEVIDLVNSHYLPNDD